MHCVSVKAIKLCTTLFVELVRGKTTYLTKSLDTRVVVALQEGTVCLDLFRPRCAAGGGRAVCASRAAACPGRPGEHICTNCEFRALTKA